MAFADVLPFREALGLELTTQDRREAGKRGWNPYALPIMLGAADECAEAVAKGATREAAFSACFNATRSMHSVARRLGLALDVERGGWVAMQAEGGAK